MFEVRLGAVSALDGDSVGDMVGPTDGELVGDSVGDVVGPADGELVGDNDGEVEGASVGSEMVGGFEGDAVDGGNEAVGLSGV